MITGSKISIAAFILATLVLAVGCGGGGSTYNASVGTTGSSGNTGSTGTTGTNGGTGSVSQITDLGVGVNPLFIDDTGRIAVASSGNPSFYFLKNGVRTDPPPSPDGGTLVLIDMNYKGTVLVNSYTTVSTAFPTGFKGSYLLQNGVYTPLAQVFAFHKTASANSLGRPALGALHEGKALAENDWVVGTDGVYWTSPSTPVTYPSMANFVPLAINSSGTIVGAVQPSFPFAQTGDVYYKIAAGVASNMGYNSGFNYISGYDAAAINDAGTIAISSDQQTRIFVGGGSGSQVAPFEINGRMTNDGRFSGRSAAVQIDPDLNLLDGAAVYSLTAGISGNIKKFFAPGTPDKINFANGINNSGQLIGAYQPGGKNTPSHGYQVTITPSFFIGSAIKLTFTGGAATLEGGGTSAFAVRVENTPNQAVTWAVDEPAGGTISSAGVYTGPLKPGTYHVRVTSSADNRISVTAPITIVGIGGETGPTYRAPQEVSGPTGGVVVTAVEPSGAMVGYSKNSAPQEALYWYSSTATYQPLIRTGYTGARATGIFSGVIVGLLFSVDQGGTAYSVAACWPTASSAPVLLRVGQNSTVTSGSAPSIGITQSIVSGNTFWSSYSALGTTFASWPNPTPSQRTVTLGDGSIVVLGSPGYRYADKNAAPVALPSGIFAGAFAASYTGDDIVGYSGSFAPPIPTIWSRSTGYSSTPIALPSILDTATPVFAEPGLVAGLVKYADGTKGIGLFQTGTPYRDLRALIPPGSGWSLTGFIGDSSGDYIVTGIKQGGVETTLYVRSN